MKTVRFSKVVEKCGKPEVYLLMTETDPDFQKALEADRVMSLSGDSHGAGTEYGTVGYDKKRTGQLLVFPKTLKAFEDLKVVGVKYDLFAQDETNGPAPKKKTKAKDRAKKAKAHAATKPAVRPPKKAEKAPPGKVINFSEPEAADENEAEDESVSELNASLRQAIRSLEKNNSVVAYKILKRTVGEST